jgi:hypothetical protein
VTAERVLSAVLAVCCLFALGTSAAALDAAVDTTPDDVIDVDVATLPLPSDDVTRLKRQIQSESTGDQRTGEVDRPSRSGSPQERPQSGSQDASDSADSSDRSGPRSAPSTGQGDERVPGSDDPTLLERLLALLRRLLELLVSVLPVLVVAGLVAAGVRYRDRLRASLARLADRFGLGTDANEASDHRRGTPEPSNEVEAAWFEMVRSTGLTDETTRTPRQYAEEAVDAGADPAVVNALTEMFERVRYGGDPVTDRRRERARRNIQRIRAQLRGSESR